MSQVTGGPRRSRDGEIGVHVFKHCGLSLAPSLFSRCWLQPPSTSSRESSFASPATLAAADCVFLLLFAQSSQGCERWHHLLLLRCWLLLLIESQLLRSLLLTFVVAGLLASPLYGTAGMVFIACHLVTSMLPLLPAVAFTQHRQVTSAVPSSCAAAASS